MKDQEEMEKKNDGIVAFSFNVEVIQVPKQEKQFIVRVPTPHGGVGVACCGYKKDFYQFISSL